MSLFIESIHKHKNEGDDKMSKSKDVQSSKISDDQIVDLYCNRNEQAIWETDVKYGNMLFTIAYNILYDPQDCEECKNDTYFNTWNAIPPSRPTMFSVFLSKIMRNNAINKYKEKTCQKRIPSELTVSIDELQDFLHSANTVETEYEAKELGKIISEYLRVLTKRQRYIFMERFYFAETIEHISKECGIGVATVHREITKIKQGLKAHLERNGVYL